MSFIDKLKFWKREDDFDFDSAVDKSIGGDNNDLFASDGTSPTTGEKSPFDQPQPQQQQQPGQQPTPSPQETSAQQPQSLQQAQQQRNYGNVPQPGSENRQLELLNSKLDTIKAILNSLDQRVANLEKVAGIQKKEEEKLW